MLWRLADQPGTRVARRQLLRDVWRIHHEPDTNSVEVHVSRLRAKLSGAGCPSLIETAPEGGYRLALHGPLLLAAEPPEDDALDAYLRQQVRWPVDATG